MLARPPPGTVLRLNRRPGHLQAVLLRPGQQVPPSLPGVALCRGREALITGWDILRRKTHNSHDLESLGSNRHLTLALSLR